MIDFGFAKLELGETNNDSTLSEEELVLLTFVPIEERNHFSPKEVLGYDLMEVREEDKVFGCHDGCHTCGDAMDICEDDVEMTESTDATESYFELLLEEDDEDDVYFDYQHR